MRSFRALVLRFDVIAGRSSPAPFSVPGMAVSIHTLARDHFLRSPEMFSMQCVRSNRNVRCMP
jgi:hypothetical protein